MCVAQNQTARFDEGFKRLTNLGRAKCRSLATRKPG